MALIGIIVFLGFWWLPLGQDLYIYQSEAVEAAAEKSKNSLVSIIVVGSLSGGEREARRGVD